MLGLSFWYSMFIVWYWSCFFALPSIFKFWCLWTSRFWKKMNYMCFSYSGDLDIVETLVWFFKCWLINFCYCWSKLNGFCRSVIKVQSVEWCCVFVIVICHQGLTFSLYDRCLLYVSDWVEGSCFTHEMFLIRWPKFCFTFNSSMFCRGYNLTYLNKLEYCNPTVLPTIREA